MMCMYLYESVHVIAGAHGGRGAGSPELELQLTVSHPTLVLGDILGSSGREATAVN